MLNVIRLISVPSQWHLQWTGKLLWLDEQHRQLYEWRGDIFLWVKWVLLVSNTVENATFCSYNGSDSEIRSIYWYLCTLKPTMICCQEPVQVRSSVMYLLQLVVQCFPSLPSSCVLWYEKQRSPWPGVRSREWLVVEMTYLFPWCFDVKLKPVALPILMDTIDFEVDHIAKHVDNLWCSRLGHGVVWCHGSCVWGSAS